VDQTGACWASWGALCEAAAHKRKENRKKNLCANHCTKMMEMAGNDLAMTDKGFNPLQIKKVESFKTPPRGGGVGVRTFSSRFFWSPFPSLRANFLACFFRVSLILFFGSSHIWSAGQ